MMDVTVSGQCLCTAVQFEARGHPIWVGHCHCQSCRRHTGSAVATFVSFRPEQIQFSRDARRTYCSSPGVRRKFCGECGTPLSYEADRFPGELHLYLCSLNEPERYLPQFHVFYRERVPWFEVADELPRHARTTFES